VSLLLLTIKKKKKTELQIEIRVWIYSKRARRIDPFGAPPPQQRLNTCICLCSADGSTHTENNKLYRKVKHRYRPNLFPRQRPTAKARPDQAALAASAEARGATHRAHGLGVRTRNRTAPEPQEAKPLSAASTSRYVQHTLVAITIDAHIYKVSYFLVVPETARRRRQRRRVG